MLEERQLLSGGWQPTTTNLADVQNGPMAPFGGTAHQPLRGVPGRHRPARPPCRSSSRTSSSRTTRCSWVSPPRPISRGSNPTSPTWACRLSTLTRPTTWSTAGCRSASCPPPPSFLRHGTARPICKPVVYGAAINEAAYSTFANVASQQSGLNGAGVTVGVISDSFNTSGVEVMPRTSPPATCRRASTWSRKGPPAATDEGRAMSQNIYHIAPGAGLAFATAGRHRPAIRPQHPRPGQCRRRTSSSTTSARPPSLSSSPAPSPRRSTGRRPGHLLLLLRRQRIQPRLPVELPRCHRHRDGPGHRHVPELRRQRRHEPPVADHRQRRQHQHHLPVRPAVGHRRSPRAGPAQPRRSTSMCWIPAATSSPREPTTMSPRANPSNS